MKAGTISQIKGKGAKEDFEKLSAGLIKQGIPPQQAYAQAAQTVAAQVTKAAAQSKHRLLSRYATQQALIARVDKAKSLSTVAVRMMDDIDFDRRAIKAMADGEVSAFLMKHHPDLAGRAKEPMSFVEFMKALKGEPTADLTAKAMADAMNHLNEWFRKSLNSFGHNVQKLDGWGFSHQHSSYAINRAGRAQWKADTDAELDWMGMIDPRTGQTFAAVPNQTMKDAFLNEVFDNIIYGRTSRTATWGGGGSGRVLERHRILKFKNSDAWVRYNTKYGSSDPMTTLLAHMDRMSQEVAIAKHLGADPDTALDYMGQYIDFKGRQNDVGRVQALKNQGGMALAKRMLTYVGPGVEPNGNLGRWSAKFFSTTRHVLTSALLDRAIVISVPSDLNSARLASQAVGMNPANFMSTYVGLMKDSLAGGGTTRDDLLRQGHIAESFANPAVAMDRYQTEFPGAVWAERTSNAVMQLSGLTAHTDNLKMAVQRSLAGHFASLKDTAWADIPDALRLHMQDRGGITQTDWDEFRQSGGLFTSANGGTFLDPLYWRQNNTLGNPDRVDDLFLLMQSYSEKFTELSVPSGSLIAKGVMDPKSWGLAPGSPAYELMKSAGMFKSFVGAFVINQVRMVNATNSHWTGATGRGAKAAYLAEMAATMTMVGALAIQVNELLMGRDPQNMADTNPDGFWLRAMLRGGGLGPVGDLLSVGQTSWMGGFPAYAAGPVPQALQDTFELTLGNVFTAANQLAKGEDVDTGFLKEGADFVSRYTPGAQLPLLLGGQAFDRLFADQMLLLLDPEAVDAMAAKATRRENLYGNAAFWPPGAPIPTRAPDMGNIWQP